MDEKFWDEIREEFPVSQKLAYFHSAGMSPIPNRVLKGVTEAYRKINQFGDMYFLDDLERTNLLKGKLAKLINTQTDNVCFAQNTSIAFSFVAAALKKHGPQVFNLVSLYDEFPASNVPFEFQGIPMKFIKPDNHSYSIESILNEVDSNTLGVVCSYVQYSTGFMLEMEKLGKALKDRGLLFIVNATQAFPVYEVDVQKMHIDAMTVSFHKWGLCAVAGTLFYTSEDFRKSYPLPMAGWLSIHPPEDDFIPTQKNVTYKQYESAEQYNFGTMNFQALIGLDVSIEFILEIGRDRIRERIISLNDYLVDRLKELPLEIISPVERPENRSAIILINLKNADNTKANEFLRKHNIITSVRAGNIRISCNFFNNFKEIDQLINVLELFSEMQS
ncbi:MAG: aminotransferase class V-fold PLP-dependent enzyme [Bacteroidetes bacterium]|nr:MAG: aminotransferase class V-fold PLP-dependent enzyme [Bacteroidota bacterium]